MPKVDQSLLLKDEALGALTLTAPLRAQETDLVHRIRFGIRPAATPYPTRAHCARPTRHMERPALAVDEDAPTRVG